MDQEALIKLIAMMAQRGDAAGAGQMEANRIVDAGFGNAGPQADYGQLAQMPTPAEQGTAAGHRMLDHMGFGQDSPELGAPQAQDVGYGGAGGPNIPAMTGPTPPAQQDQQDKKQGIDPAVLAALAAQMPSAGAGVGRMIDRLRGHNAGQVTMVPAGTYR